MTSTLLLLIITVLTALIFDFLNGFHDAANSIATVVSTRVLSPKLAVLWAAFFNFVAAFFLGTAVAKTIGQGMIRVSSVTQYVVIAGLVGAIVWDLLTWWWGLPTSSSHALIGGYAGAAVMRSGLGVILPGGWTKTLVFILVAPIMGLVLGLTFMVAVLWLLKNKAPQRVDAWFRRLQLVSAAAYSIGLAVMTRKKPWGLSPLPSMERSFSLVPNSPVTGGTFIGLLFLPPRHPSLSEPISAAGELFIPWAPELQNLSR